VDIVENRKTLRRCTILVCALIADQVGAERVRSAETTSDADK
jgi:hypothetical protein